MPIFQLVLQSTSDDPLETLQFGAADIKGALDFANQQSPLVQAELWQEGECVARLIYSHGERGWLTEIRADEEKVNCID